MTFLVKSHATFLTNIIEKKNDYYSDGYQVLSPTQVKLEKKHLLLLPNESECHKREIGFAEKDAIKVSN